MICSFLLFHLLNLEFLLIMLYTLIVQNCHFKVCGDRAIVDVFWEMRPKLEDSARKLNKSMSSIRIFDFF